MNDKDKADEEFSKIRSEGRTDLSDKEMKKAKKTLKMSGLRQAASHIKDFLSLLHAVFNDSYKVSLEVIIAVVSAILYLIWVLDVIPDFIPLIGYLDDTAVILATARICAIELEDFRKWKDTNK